MILVAIFKTLFFRREIALVEFYGVRFRLSPDGRMLRSPNEELNDELRVVFRYGERDVPEGFLGRILEELQNLGRTHNDDGECAWEAITICGLPTNRLPELSPTLALLDYPRP